MSELESPSDRVANPVRLNSCDSDFDETQVRQPTERQFSEEELPCNDADTDGDRTERRYNDQQYKQSMENNYKEVEGVNKRQLNSVNLY